MARPIDKIIVTDEQLSELRPRVKSPRTSKRDPLRAEILLLRSSGMGGKAVAKRLLVSENCVSKWTTRFRQGGIDSLADKSGRGRAASIPLEKVEEVITKATRSNRIKTFKGSNDPHFEATFRDERFFADITSECIREGSFGGVKELEASIKKYISARNASPKPCRWIAKGQDLLEKINRAGKKLNKPVYEH